MMMALNLMLVILAMLVLGALLVLAVVGIVWALTRSRATGTPGRSSAAAGPDPIDVVRQRYARGEISREEYLGIREDLEHRDRPDLE